jgi:uncharacterized membrane-anchored protein
MEFASYTFINLGAGNDHQPFEDTGISSLPMGWLEKLTGTVVAAFHIDLQQAAEGTETDLAQIRHWFEGERLVGSSPWEGKARVWGTFRLHSDKFGRFMVLNRDMSDSQLGRLTQRLMEIETYRLMSLLALPLAREITPSLNEMDQQLAVITQSLADNQNIDEREVLANLTNVAARIEAFRAHSTFRFSATRAYHQLVLTRLEELREDELSGHLTIGHGAHKGRTGHPEPEPAAAELHGPSLQDPVDDAAYRGGAVRGGHQLLPDRAAETGTGLRLRRRTGFQ